MPSNAQHTYHVKLDATTASFKTAQIDTLVDSNKNTGNTSQYLRSTNDGKVYWSALGSGVPGVIGATGATGPIGATGSIGPVGATGIIGVQGTQGATGPIGPDGVRGPRGATGPAFLIGATGPNGEIGGITFDYFYETGGSTTLASGKASSLNDLSSGMTLTSIYLHETDQDSVTAGNFYTTNATKSGYIMIQPKTATSTDSDFIMLEYSNITGPVNNVYTVNGIIVLQNTLIDPIANGEEITLQFVIYGTIGATGATGPPISVSGTVGAIILSDGGGGVVAANKSFVDVTTGRFTLNDSIDIQSTNSTQSIGIGYSAGTVQGTNSIAIGNTVGNTNGNTTIAIGAGAGIGQNDQSISIGNFAGFTGQQNNSIAIGTEAGKTSLSSNTIAIGKLSGSGSTASNSIILNASGSALNSTNSGLYINPIRTSTSNVNNVLVYGSDKEVMSNSVLYVDSSNYEVEIYGDTIISKKFLIANSPSYKISFNGTDYLNADHEQAYIRSSTYGLNGGNLEFWTRDTPTSIKNRMTLDGSGKIRGDLSSGTINDRLIFQTNHATEGFTNVGAIPNTSGFNNNVAQFTAYGNSDPDQSNFITLATDQNGFGVLSSSKTGTGTTGDLIVRVGSNATAVGNECIRVNTNHDTLFLDNVNPSSSTQYSEKIQTRATSSSGASMSLNCYDPAAGPGSLNTARLTFRKIITNNIDDHNSLDTPDKVGLGYIDFKGVISGTDTRLSMIRSFVDDTTGGNISFATQKAGGTFTEKMIIKNDGKVGIGTNTPDALLETSSVVAGNSVGALLTNTYQTGTSDSVSLNFGLGRTPDAHIFSISAIQMLKEQQWTSVPSTVNGALVFSTIQSEIITERMRITSSGDLYINKLQINSSSTQTTFQHDTSDDRSLFIASGGGASDTRGAYIWARGNDTTSNPGLLQLNAGNKAGNDGRIIMYTGGSERITVEKNGNVGIGAGYTATKTLDVNGSFNTTGSSTLNNWFKCESLSKQVLAGQTATVDINAGTGRGFVKVYISVSFVGNGALNAFFDYELLTVDTQTAGGGTSIRQTLNESVGSFQVSTTDFAVTRPGSGVIRITYTNQPSGNNSIQFYISGKFDNGSTIT